MCMFLQSHVNFIENLALENKIQSGENDQFMVYPWIRQISHLKQYILYVYVYDVFSVSVALSILYSTHL